nr:vegetative cell wall protein gp1-like [Aegilops tauschii subsp. strangulata]
MAIVPHGGGAGSVSMAMLTPDNSLVQNMAVSPTSPSKIRGANPSVFLLAPPDAFLRAGHVRAAALGQSHLATSPRRPPLSPPTAAARPAHGRPAPGRDRAEPPHSSSAPPLARAAADVPLRRAPPSSTRRAGTCASPAPPVSPPPRTFSATPHQRQPTASPHRRSPPQHAAPCRPAVHARGDQPRCRTRVGAPLRAEPELAHCHSSPPRAGSGKIRPEESSLAPDRLPSPAPTSPEFAGRIRADLDQIHPSIHPNAPPSRIPSSR